MQSGISASQALHAAFGTFLSTPTQFCLPVTITSETLTPLDPLSFTSSSFTQSLPALTPHLQPSTPIYLLLRRSPEATTFTAITYVPSTAPVRSKTLFASTRASLVRELGLEKFEETRFVTDKEEVLEEKEWVAKTAGAGGVDPGLLSREERELQGVKRAEEEARHGTGGMALGGLGGGSGGDGVTSSGAKLQMKMTEEAKSALGGFAREGKEGALLQLGIDVATETLTLLGTREGVQPGELRVEIPADRPSYSFYRHPASAEAVLFVYACPGTSKVKERMVYASSRSGVLEAAKAEGVLVSKRLEAGAPEEVTEERLNEEAGAGVGGDNGGTSTPRGGFSRPKRPGRR